MWSMWVCVSEAAYGVGEMGELYLGTPSCFIVMWCCGDKEVNVELWGRVFTGSALLA